MTKTNAKQVITNKILRAAWSYIYKPNGDAYYEKNGERIKPLNFELTYPIKVRSYR